MKLRLLFAAIALATVLPLCAQQPLHIGTITIHALDVYSHEEAAHGSVYRLADRLHKETRSGVVAQFLLFHEGDVYSPVVLEETERNLRALSFLKSASVVPSAPHDGVVDVTVTTQDSWSIAPEAQAGSKGGTNTFGANIEDSNVFGFGKQIGIGWNHGVDRNTLGFNYNDPAFFAPYWRAHIGLGFTSDGFDRRFSIARPFYSFTTPWATHFSYTDIRQNDRIYRSGLALAQFHHDYRLLNASYGFAVNPSETEAERFTAGIRFLDDRFSSMSGSIVPLSREYRYLFVRYDSARNRFLKLNFVNKDLRYEDFDLGRQYSIEAAVSPTFLGAPISSGYFRLGAGEGKPLSEDGFILAAANVSSRLESGFRNAIANASLTYVHRDLGDHPMAFVARGIINSGWRTDRNVQFFADGATGLRGYPLHAFAGTRSAILNLEQRLYLGRELLQLASPAVVAFFDAGDASSSGLRFKSDVGIGIRIGLPRSPRNLLRFDLAFPLQNDPLGRRKPMLSFSSGQAF